MPELRITVRVRPGASRTAVGGSWGDQGHLLVAVTAPPVDGAATVAVVRALADALDLRPGDGRVVSGHSARTKIVSVTATDPEHADRLRTRLDDLRR